MHKQPTSITLLITIITLLLLTSCSTPAVAPTTTPKVTPVPTPVVTATPIPTATPRTEPYSPEEAKASLEAIIGIDATYEGEINGLDSYNFIACNKSFLVRKNDGSVLGYVNKEANKKDENTFTQIDKTRAKEIAIDEIKIYYPTLFDYEIEYIIEGGGETDYYIDMYQLSENGNRTGNEATARIMQSGIINNITIHNQEDPSIVDKPIEITKGQAIEIAYKACQDKIEEVKQSTKEPDFDVFFDERDTHEVTAILKVWKGRQMWMVDIKNIRNNRIAKNGPDRPMYMSSTIDANTGEIIGVGGY